jgi:transposase
MYPTNLTDSQWEGIANFFDVKRKRAYSLRRIIDAIMYISKTGAQWHMLPKEFPPTGITFYYFRQWTQTGLWQKILLHQTKEVRIKTGKDKEPSTLIIDSQSIKNSERGVDEKGFDGHKKIQGRKRHLITDSNGRLLSCIVGRANEHDLPAGERLVQQVMNLPLPKISFLVADGAYTKLVDWAKDKFELKVQISKQVKEQGFVPVAHRWKVERFISWMMWSRRLSRDYEVNLDSSQAWVMIQGIRNTLHFF